VGVGVCGMCVCRCVGVGGMCVWVCVGVDAMCLCGCVGVEGVYTGIIVFVTRLILMRHDSLMFDVTRSYAT